MMYFENLTNYGTLIIIYVYDRVFWLLNHRLVYCSSRYKTHIVMLLHKIFVHTAARIKVINKGYKLAAKNAMLMHKL